MVNCTEDDEELNVRLIEVGTSSACLTLRGSLTVRLGHVWYILRNSREERDRSNRAARDNFSPLQSLNEVKNRTVLRVRAGVSTFHHRKILN
jgi:hypothetical protein